MKLTAQRLNRRLGLYLLFQIFLCRLFTGDSLKIRPKLCYNALGEEGTCMFVWECIKTEGKHLGTCVDGFLFGSCCGHNESHNSIDQNHSSTLAPSFVSQTNLIKTRPTLKPNITTASTFNKPINFSKPTSTTKRPVTSKPTTSKPNVASVQSASQSTTSSSVFNQIPIANQSNLTHSSISKPWPTAPSPIHAQVWPIQSNVPPNVLHTFRPPIFSLFSTFRPPGSNIYLRPTFRPPIIMKPTSIYQQIHNTRTTTTTTTTTTTPTTTTTTTTSTTTPATLLFSTSKPINNSTTTKAPSTSITTENQEANLILQNVVTKRPIITANGKVQCGVPNLHPQTKVVGGKNAAFGAWPWQVSVRRTSFFGFSSTHRCGGAILNNQWIATAGHCVDDLLLTQIRIRVGEYDFASVLEPYPYIERGAKKKVVHPHYNFFTYENDLALVQLDDPIEFQPHVGPICLPPEHIELIGRNATVTGWGRLSEGGILPSVLQEVKVPIVSNDKCKNMFLTAGRHEYIPEIFMCAGYDEGGRDSCQGDSGGPLQVQGDDGKWFLAGIISWGIGCGEPSLPGVCTRISKFRQWILSNIS